MIITSKLFQIITSGTDRKLGYWDALDGSQIREIDASMTGEVNGMDISPDGEEVVTGGGDKLVKVEHVCIFIFRLEVSRSSRGVVVIVLNFGTKSLEFVTP